MSNTPPVNEVFSIPSMDCSEEFSLIQRGLKGTPGIRDLAANYLERQLLVSLDPTQVDRGRIEQRLREIGFPAVRRPEAGESSTDAGGGQFESVSQILRSAPLPGMIGAILLSLGFMLWLRGAYQSAAWASLVAALVCGWRVAEAGWRAARLRHLDMNALMTIAAIGAIALGDWHEAGTAMFLFSISIWLERISTGRARRAIQSLVELTPTVAHRLPSRSCCNHGHEQEHSGDPNQGDEEAARCETSDVPQSEQHQRDSDITCRRGLDRMHGRQIEDVDVSQLSVGDLLLVRPGERIPADGVVVEGDSDVDTASVTGESVPVDVVVGDTVFAGCLNGESSLMIRVSTPVSQSVVSHVGRLVELAHQSRAKTERFVDRFARFYTPAIVTLAVGIAIFVPLWMLGQGRDDWATQFPHWIRRALVILVTGCPCALVISTPVTIVCGLARAAQCGLFVKGGEYLEAAAGIDAIAVDKTGTLTLAAMNVSHVEVFGTATENRVLTIAAALEHHSEHPLARAIVRAARDRQLSIPEIEGFQSYRGMGVTAKAVGADVVVGSRRFLEESGCDFRDVHMIPASNPSPDDRKSSVWVAAGGRVCGCIRLADTLHPHAKEAIVRWRQLGVKRVVMLTGDRMDTAMAFAKQVGIDEVHSQLLPEDKMRLTQQIVATSPELAMIGDGVNDAPALATARIGIAIGQASDTALESADVVSISSDLRRVGDLLSLGKQTRTVLWQNVGTSLVVKFAVLTLATVGLATMWMAVAADVGVRLLVVANGLRLLRATVDSARPLVPS
ncbi:MAG: cation-translocating P-type ATPase [Planctomycetales bacterium]|nr:cation-translocating P-type ATPase [Planctomycetales bacterium]